MGGNTGEVKAGAVVAAAAGEGVDLGLAEQGFRAVGAAAVDARTHRGGAGRRQRPYLRRPGTGVKTAAQIRRVPGQSGFGQGDPRLRTRGSASGGGEFGVGAQMPYRGQARRAAFGGPGTGVMAHVVDGIGLRKYGGAIGPAAPVAAHGQVQQNEIGLVKSLHVRRDQPGAKGHVVDIPGETLRRPVHAVHVEIIREFGGIAVADAQGRVVVGGIEVVQGAVGGVVAGVAGRAAYHFHNVDFAACRPIDIAAVQTPGVAAVAQQPEGRPHALGGWQFGAHFEAPVGKAFFARGLNARRGVRRVARDLSFGSDGE